MHGETLKFTKIQFVLEEYNSLLYWSF